MEPLYIVDVIGDIVAKVQTEKLAQLQAYDPNIQGVHYEYGPGKEILETLKQKETPAFRMKKYPLVALLMDFPENRNPQTGIYAATELTIIICYHTIPAYKTAERYEKSFKPVLYPIYMSFIDNLKTSAISMIKNAEIPHEKIDRPYYGRDNKNVGNDFLDAIEISGLKLNLYDPNCFTEGKNL